MARNTTEANVTVTLNGETARNELKKLEEELKNYKNAAEQAYKQGDKAIGDEITKKVQRLEQEFKVAKNEMKDFGNFLKSLNSKSLNELRSAAKQLEGQIRKLSPASEDYVKKSEQLRQVNTRIKQLQSEFKGLVLEEKNATFSLKSLADGFNKYFGMVTAGVAAVTGVSMAFRKAAQDAAALDDTYSDVMKTTGLLHDEVKELDEELMKIDTRTSREQLLLLARDAGKLGIQGKENILGFVRAADKIQVALGEDLGDGAIRNLGKIADVLGYTSSMGIEKSLLSIGSAINAVGQASTANEAYLVDFTQRMAGVAAQTNISAADIIGFASGLDQSAMKVEMASTAFQKFLMKLYEDPAKFAKYANLEVKEFTDLLNKDANQAIITVLKSLKDNDGFGALVPIFKDMGLDGARAVSVLAAMATNINAVTEAQALANEEFEKANSVTEEYSVKNNNAQANLEKARKEFQNASIALGQSLNPIMLKSTKATTYLIKALVQYGNEIKKVVIVIAALTVALKAKVIWLKAVAAWNATIKTGSLALAAAQALLTGNITRATAAWKLMNTAMKASVIGVAVAAVSALWIGIDRLVKKQRQATKTTKELTEAEKWEAEVAEKISKAKSEEAGRVQALNKILHNENVAYRERLKALNELKQMIPDYHAKLTKEGQLINDNTTAVENYIKALKKEAVMKELESEFGSIEAERIRLESAIEELKNSIDGQSIVDEAGKYNKAFGKTTIEIMKLEKELEKVNEKSLKMEGMIAKAIAIDGGEETSGGGGGGGMSEKEAKKAYDARIKVIEEGLRKEENLLKRRFMNGEIDQAEYNARMNLLTMQGLQDRIKAAQQFGQDATKFTSQLLDEEMKLMKDGTESIKDELIKTSSSNIRDPQANKEFWDAVYKKRDNIVSELQEQSLQSEYETELKWLEKLHDKKLLSEEQFEKARFNLRVKYTQQFAEQSGQIAEEATNFITALKNYETQQLEAQYQAQLTAAGDNAEQREQIEAEYEQKKLDLQKKYADVEMVVNIAKAVASGALAAIEAYAAAGNPILGAVFAGLIAAVTALEVATIVQQRNAIKNASVSNTNSSSVKTGQRTVTGYAEGGYTEDHTTLTTVGERGTEWVAPHWMLQKDPVTFANLERYRKAGSHGRSGSMKRGFADGGYTNASYGQSAMAAQATLDVDWQAMRDFNEIMRYCAENGLFVKYGDILIAKEKLNNFKSQTSR